MKIILYSIFLIFFFFSTSIADELYLKDTRIIKCKIIQITNTNIEYSEYNGSPFQIISRDHVVKVVYDNGEIVQVQESGLTSGSEPEASQNLHENNPENIVVF